MVRVVNEVRQVIVLDLSSGTEEVASVSDAGAVGNDLSVNPALSADGRFVAFNSRAGNLTPGIVYAKDVNQNSYTQVLVRDRLLGRTRLVSISADGTASADTDAMLSQRGAFSSDGTKLVFASAATNLTSGVDYPRVNGQPPNVFVHDLQNDRTTLVSVSPDGLSAGRNDAPIIGGARADSGYPAISADGRWVAFTSAATNLVTGIDFHDADQDQVYLRDLVHGQTRLLSSQASGDRSADGVCVVYASGSRTYISADGQRVVYACRSSPLVAGITGPADPQAWVYDIYLWDGATNHNTLVSRSAVAPTGSDCQSLQAVLSGDGRYVAFQSCASNLVTGTTFHSYDSASPPFPNAYRWDSVTGRMALISRSRQATRPESADSDVIGVDISDDGQQVSFVATARNLVVAPEVTQTPTDLRSNLYVWRAAGDQLKLVSLSQDNLASGWAESHAMAANGRGVAYVQGQGLAKSAVYVELN